MVLGSVNRSLRLPRPGGRGSLWLAIRVPRAWRLTRLARIGLAEAVGTQGVPVEDRHGCGASNTGRGLGWHEAVMPVFGLSNSPSPRARQSHCGVSRHPERRIQLPAEIGFQHQEFGLGNANSLVDLEFN
jgi:hypothetical protein